MPRGLQKPTAASSANDSQGRRSIATVTVGELRANFASVELKLAAGLLVKITRRGEVVAELKAPEKAVNTPLELPDYLSRMRAIWGDQMLDIDTTALIAEGRDRDL